MTGVEAQRENHARSYSLAAFFQDSPSTVRGACPLTLAKTCDRAFSEHADLDTACLQATAAVGYQVPTDLSADNSPRVCFQITPGCAIRGKRFFKVRQQH